MRVFVTGGSGYVGYAVIQNLLACGCEVVALNRANSKRSLTHSKFSNVISCVEGDILSCNRWQTAMKGCDAVIHLVGIIRENKRQHVTMDKVHVEGTKNVLAAAKSSGIQRFIHMSALGVSQNAMYPYSQTKWEAELYVRASGIPFTIFRPSLIFGKGGPGPNFLSQLAPIIQHSPIIPIFGNGLYPLQPVSIQTVAQAFTEALTTTEAYNQTFELGGPEVLTYEEILRIVARACNRSFRPVHIPVKGIRIVLRTLDHFAWLPITNDELSMLLGGNVCSNDWSDVYDALNLTPVPFEITEDDLL